jgi:hypothetical protein
MLPSQDATLTQARHQQIALGYLSSDLDQLGKVSARTSGVAPRALQNAREHLTIQEDITYGVLKAEGAVPGDWGVWKNSRTPLDPGQAEDLLDKKPQDRVYAAQSLNQLVNTHVEFQELHRNAKLARSSEFIAAGQSLQARLGLATVYEAVGPLTLPPGPSAPTLPPIDHLPKNTRVYKSQPGTLVGPGLPTVAEARLAGLAYVRTDLESLRSAGAKKTSVDQKALKSAFAYLTAQEVATAKILNTELARTGQGRSSGQAPLLDMPQAQGVVNSSWRTRQYVANFMRDLAAGHDDLRLLHREGKMPRMSQLGDEATPDPPQTPRGGIGPAQPGYGASSSQQPAEQPPAPTPYPATLNPFSREYKEERNLRATNPFSPEWEAERQRRTTNPGPLQQTQGWTTNPGSLQQTQGWTTTPGPLQQTQGWTPALASGGWPSRPAVGPGSYQPGGPFPDIRSAANLTSGQLQQRGQWPSDSSRRTQQPLPSQPKGPGQAPGTAPGPGQ